MDRVLAKSIGRGKVPKPIIETITVDEASRPNSAANGANVLQRELIGSRPSSAQRTVPNDAIFNTQVTTAGRLFLTKVKKNRAMQVDRRAKGFHAGMAQSTVIIDPITKRHYRVLILDPDMQRREDLADSLERFFEILVAPSNERAFTLLGMFKVDFVLLFVGPGNDKSIASSPAMEFLREMKKKCFSTPAAALVPPMHVAGGEMQKLLQKALHQGGLCGYFETSLTRDQLVERLTKLLHSLVVTQSELVKSYGKSRVSSNNTDEILPVQAIKKRTTMANLGIAHSASSRPESVQYDRSAMLLELSLNQRKQCLQQRKMIAQTIEKGQHSVLGVDLSPDAQPSNSALNRPSTPATCNLTSCTTPSSKSHRSQSIVKKVPSLPSQQEVSKLIYAKPQAIQGKIHQHLYESYHVANKKDALPQDPLLHHCVAVDPRLLLPRSSGQPGSDSGSSMMLILTNAYLLYTEKRFDEAMVQCDRAIRMQSSSNLLKLVYLLRGVLFDVRGEFVSAEKMFSYCLKLDPSMHEALFNLSVCLLKRGKDQVALETLSSAIRLDPTNLRYLQNRALIFRRLGQFDLAQADYLKLLGGTQGTRSPDKSRGSPKHLASPTPTTRLTKCDLEDGVFGHLFGKPSADRLAFVCPPHDRTPEMIDSIVTRLQSLLFFQHFPPERLADVAKVIEFEVIACGKSFALVETHPNNFFILLGGRVSVRRRMGDFASSVTTHHLEPGMVFGCTGHTISTHSTLIADECVEIGIVWPKDYTLAIHSYSTKKNHEMFMFLQQTKMFRHFSTSELGHLVGISEHRRFRKGDILLEQNELPKHLIILWKGSCVMYQDFSREPFVQPDTTGNGSTGHSSDENEDGSDADDDGGEQRGEITKNLNKVLPFHRHLAKPDWPLGFQTGVQSSKSRKYLRGRRNGLALSSMASNSLAADAAYARSAIPLALVIPEKRKLKNSRIQEFVAPALFGESAFLDQHQASSKWCVRKT